MVRHFHLSSSQTSSSDLRRSSSLNTTSTGTWTSSGGFLVMSSSMRQRLWSKIFGKDEKNNSDRLCPASDQALSRVPSTSLRSSSPSSLRQRLHLSKNLSNHGKATLEEPDITTSVPEPDKDTEKALSNLWVRAADVLKLDPDPEKRSLIEHYSIIMKAEVGTVTSGDDAELFIGLQSSQAAKLLNTKAEELKNRKMMVGLGRHEVNIEPQFNKVAKHIITAKDLISSVAGADPHASVACVGVVVILAFLIRQVEQREQLFKGLEIVSSMICRYLVMETVYRPRARVVSVPEEAAKDLESDFENNLVNLYAKILEFQARALCYGQKNRASQFLRDTFGGDTWTTLMADINYLDGQCRAFADLVTDEKLLAFLDSQQERLTQSQEKTHVRIMAPDDVQQQRAQCLQLLDICPYRDRKDINPERVEGTCEWFVEHDLFRSWADSTQSSILWVSADPGCGKSVLSRFLVDHVLPNNVDSGALVYFFFKENFADQKTAPAALCSILRQLFLQRPSLLTSKIMTLLVTDGKRLTESTASLFEILFLITAESKLQIYCVLDALDECEERDRRELISTLTKFYMNPDGRQCLKLIVTSRPEMIIQRQFRRLENNWPKIHLRGEDDEQLTKISQEIDIFARSRIRSIAESLLLDPTETQFLQKEISKTKNRTYLWVKVALDDIENVLAFTTEKAAEVLAGLPEGLDMLYEKILNRSPDIAKARKVLHIVIAALRPLTLAEMSVALAISTSQQPGSDITLEPSDRFRETLRAICGLFVTIVDDRVYFIHQTAKEFLVRNCADSEDLPPSNATEEIVKTFSWKDTFVLSESNSVLAKACMAYLGSRMETSTALDAFHLSKVVPDPDNAFFRYSALSWSAHLQMSELLFQDGISSLATMLCEENCIKPLETWFSTWLIERDYTTEDGTGLNWSRVYEITLTRHHMRTIPRRPTSLIMAATCGLGMIVKSIYTENKQTLLDVDDRGRTVLWWASRQGQTDVVKILLSFSIPDEWQDRWSSVINDVQCGMTPLMVASASGHLSTVHTLLSDPRVNFRTACPDGHTAMYYAFQESQEDVANALLDIEGSLDNVHANQLWNYLCTCITKAYIGPASRIAKALPAGYQDSNGMSPFTEIVAWWGGHSALQPGLTKLDFLKTVHGFNKFDPSILDNDHRSAVWWAADTPGDPDVLIWLISDLKLNPDEPSRNKETPLSRAAMRCSKENLEILWKTGMVNINTLDCQDRTPLILAILSSDTATGENIEMIETVNWLLTNGADVNHQDCDSRTALMHAAEAGFKCIVEALVAYGASLDLCDIDGNTAVKLAEDISEDIPSPETASEAKRLPSYVSMNHTDVVEVLLRSGAKVDTEAPETAKDEGNPPT